MPDTLTPPRVLNLPSDQEASGRTLGDEEIAAVTEALRTGTLTSTKGQFTKRLEQGFAKRLGVKHAHACASGTGAVHIAVAAFDLEPGDEVITTPITDMGALTPLLYQGLIPMFADVDPRTCNVTPETVEERITDRTRAIVVTHLFGNPCDMTGIMAVANRHKLPVIEDCAQAFQARHAGKLVGTFGTIGCFSLQQGKHITTGEGGLVVTNDDALARKAYLLVNKAWGYGDPQPDHYFIALNYRLSELQGAVAVAQLPKLDDVVRRRREAAERLSEALQDLPGVETPWVDERNEHSWWKYCVRIDGRVIKGGAPGMGKVLKEYGVASAPRYIQKPAFQCAVFREQRTFGKSRWPFTLARPEALDYTPDRFPGTFAALEGILVLPWNERYTDEDVDGLAACLREAAARLS